MRVSPPNGTAVRVWPLRLKTALAAGVAAAAVSALAMIAIHHGRPGVHVRMDRQAPSGVTGFYPPERQGKTSFAWSGGHARLELAYIDRRGPWQCRADVINWRAPEASVATVRVRSGSAQLLEQVVRAPRETLGFTVPAEPAVSGFDIGIDITPTFRPGGRDPRELGLAFEAIDCEPGPGFSPRPAAAVIARGSAAAALAGAVIGLAGLPAMAALGAAACLATAQAWSLVSGSAVFSLASPPAYLIATLFGLFCLLPVALASGVLRRPLSQAARLAVVVSGCGFFAKLVFLLHPDKTVVDAVYHAHRFDSVLAGHFYFTQLSTSATPFPYAIGLYVFSAPWALLTSDHVTLLRIVVCASEAVAGALLYPLIVRAWNDRATGVLAVLLFHLLPLPYAVIGNANLTNAFGQSAALVTMVAAVSWAFEPRSSLALAGLTALASLAFLSHIGTLAFLLPTLLILAALFAAAGGRAMRGPAIHVVAAAALALALSIGLYYGHFGSVYRPQIEKARAAISATLGMSTAPAVPAGGAPEPGASAPRVARKAPPLQLGVKGAIDQTRFSLGWPIISLALAGAWCLFAGRRMDRLVLGLAAWASACAIFLGWSIVRTVDPLYVQDAWEFIGRVELATSPAGAILAACGATWAWRSGLILRCASVLLIGAAVKLAAGALSGWIL